MHYTTNVKNLQHVGITWKKEERIWAKAKKKKSKSVASQVVKQAISWLTRRTKVPLYRGEGAVRRQSASVSPLAANPVV